MRYASKTCLIWEAGLFVSLAERLARDFGRVLYACPWKNAYPKAAAAHIGYGLPGVERVLNFWDHVDEADIIIFPDIYDSDMQKICERLGKPVWGNRDAERMELNRWEMRKLQKRLGISAPETKLFTCVEDLEDHLKEVENKYVKISTFRGDQETWHHDTWHTTEILLDDFTHRVGALKNQYEFIVEDAIDGVELAYDGWTVHGKFPDKVYFGYEIKDKGYVGKFVDYKDLPEPIQEVNKKLSPILELERAVGFCAFEMRINGDGKPYLYDPCMRAFSPPIEVMMEAYTNIAEIIWEGAHGRLVQPESGGEFVAELMIHSNFALTNWVPIEFPEEIRNWVKLRNAAMIDGKLYHVPVGGDMPEIGAVVAVADSMEEAINLVKERAEKIKGHLLEIPVQALDDAQEEIEKGKKVGVKF